MRGFVLVFTIITVALLIVGCAAPVEAPLSPGSLESGPASGAENLENTLTSIKNDDRFTAQITPDRSAILTWQPINGAEKYLLEIQLDDESLLPVALLEKDILSYEDVDLPPDTVFIYQLTAVTGSERKDSRRVGVQTAPPAPDPLTVTLEFDLTQPVMDFTNIDPENFDPSVLMDLFPTDESGEMTAFDPSMFVPSPIEETRWIGPEGGEVSVTGSNEFVYTLTVPQGALMFEVPVTLKPVSAIPDLPLSGGMDAAVMIEPEGIPLVAPATLTIYAPEGFITSTGELDLGFSFEGDGAEFHLYPLVEDGEQARAAVRMAKIVAKPKNAGPLAQIAQQQLDQFAGFGKGSGSKEDVKKVSKRLPNKAKNRAAASAAAARQAGKFVQPLEDAFDEELTPLMTPQELAMAKLGESVRQQAEKAGNMTQLMDALDDFQVYYQNGGDKFNQKLNDRILDALVKATYNLFKGNLGKCLTAEDLKTQAMVDRLVNGKGAAIKAISARFKEKYGSKLLEDLYHGMKPCTYELGFKSSLSYSVEGSTWTTNTEVKPFPLFPVYSSGDLFLFGSGSMVQTQSISGFCSAPITQYNDLKFVAQKLVPEFGTNGLLRDFVMTRYFVAGMEQLKGVDIDTDKRGCERSISYQGGGDFWSAFFTISRATTGQFELSNWKIEGDIANGNSIIAKWESVRDSFSPMGEPGTMSEDSKFTLKIQKNP